MNGPCSRMQDQILDALVEPLAPEPQQALLDHIESCPDCATFQRDINQQIQSLACLSQTLEAEMPDRISRCITALDQAHPGAPGENHPKWRTLMLTHLMKISAAAVIAVAISLYTLLVPERSDSGFPSIMASAEAAESAWFHGQQCVHIKNEITVFPTTSGQQMGSTWIPMCAMKADGQLRMDQLKLTVTPDAYTVLDQAWYDPPTGRFIRQLQTDQDLAFANAYDGSMVYTSAMSQSGLEIQKQMITGEFVAPNEPAQFFGLAAGLKSGLDEESMMILDTQEDTLSDGSAVHVFKVGTRDPEGRVQAYWLFRIRDDDKTIAEKEFIIQKQTQLLIRRVSTEYVEAADIHWDLRELASREVQPSQVPRVTVTPNMVIPNVSVQHMIEKSDFETYVFAQVPAWCNTVKITDVLDPASPGKRMFLFTCRAEDKRHLVLVQSPTYNKMLGQVIGQGDLIYESPNGFKVVGGGRSKWLANILLQSAQHELKDPPSEDRIGFILQSPEGTYPALAINGPVCDEELHTLIDSLIPAKEWLKSAKTE
ncbi:MAG: hypothetical protein GY809_33380 [Planctomycetes bacterium]|nr:hypothetical protein [Planctomycetota bacterium]